MIEFLCEKLMAWCERNGRVFKITGTAGPDDVYLIRYYVIRSKWFNVFLHQFLRSDRDDLHDHPWHFATYLVRGAYSEVKWNEKIKGVEYTYRQNQDTYCEVVDGYTGRARFNTLVFRKATDQHQVVVFQDLKEAEKHLAPLTLFVSGPTFREWGFIKEITTQNDGVTPISEQYRPLRKWIGWREYLGLPSNTPGRG